MNVLIPPTFIEDPIFIPRRHSSREFAMMFATMANYYGRGFREHEGEVFEPISLADMHSWDTKEEAKKSDKDEDTEQAP